jgi:hypothetical protein
MNFAAGDYSYASEKWSMAGGPEDSDSGGSRKKQLWDKIKIVASDIAGSVDGLLDVLFENGFYVDEGRITNVTAALALHIANLWANAVKSGDPSEMIALSNLELDLYREFPDFFPQELPRAISQPDQVYWTTPSRMYAVLRERDALRSREPVGQAIDFKWLITERATRLENARTDTDKTSQVHQEVAPTSERSGAIPGALELFNRLVPFGSIAAIEELMRRSREAVRDDDPDSIRSFWELDELHRRAEQAGVKVELTPSQILANQLQKIRPAWMSAMLNNEFGELPESRYLPPVAVPIWPSLTDSVSPDQLAAVHSAIPPAAETADAPELQTITLRFDSKEERGQAIKRYGGPSKLAKAARVDRSDLNKWKLYGRAALSKNGVSARADHIEEVLIKAM